MRLLDYMLYASLVAGCGCPPSAPEAPEADLTGLRVKIVGTSRTGLVVRRGYAPFGSSSRLWVVRYEDDMGEVHETEFGRDSLKVVVIDVEAKGGPR